ncbi:MAG: motility protein A [Planctomycetaceae bacterium]|nr:motility protein A [Planctomycetaceae bacterium]
MDIGTVVGLILGTVMIAISVPLGGGSFGAFWNTSGIVMVFCGAACCVLTSFPLKHVMKFMAIVKKAVFNKEVDLITAIEQIVSLAESARREGLLSLENRIEEINDPFLRLGIRMAIDGMGADIVESVMRTEVDAVAGRHEGGKAVLEAYAKYAPAIGMMGTLIGLVIMLGNMSPETLGPGMAVAILTTLYGAFIANILCLPVADKLAFFSAAELLRMEVTIRGIVSIQSGENPRVIKQKLLSFIPPNSRPAEEEAAA